MGTFVGLVGLGRAPGISHPNRVGASVRVPAVGIVPPAVGAPATATTGGTLAAGTYYYRVTAIDAQGRESAASAQVSQVTTGATSTVTVNWTNVPGAASYRVYRGTTDGFTTGVWFADAGTPFVDTGTAGTAGSVSRVTPDASLVPTVLKAGIVTIVDLDNTKVRQALGHHRAIGQYAVAAVNNRTAAGVTLPANS